MIPYHASNYLHSQRKKKKQRDSNISVKKVKKTIGKLITKSTKAFDIAKSRGAELKELLQYDHLGGNSLFEGDEPKKHNKAEILKELEKHLEKNEYSTDIGQNATIIVDLCQLSERFHLINLVASKMHSSACGA